MTKKAYAKVRANIIAGRKAMTQDRMGDFRYDSDVQAAVFGNLATTVAGVGRTLTRQNNRQLAALSRLAEKNGQGYVKKGAAKAADLYGIAGAAGAAPILDAASAHVVGAGIADRSKVKAGTALAKSDQTALGIAQAGVATAQAGATAQMADALRYRAKNDAALIAQEQLELAKMKLQAKLEMQNYRKQLALQDGAAGDNSATAVGNLTAGSLGELVESFRESHNPDSTFWSEAGIDPEKGATPAQVAAAWANDHGYAPDSPQYQVILAMANNLYAGGAGAPGATWTRQDLADSALSAIDLLYPNLKGKARTALEGLLVSQLTATALDNAYMGGAAPSDDGGGDDGGGNSTAIVGTQSTAGPRSGAPIYSDRGENANAAPPDTPVGPGPGAESDLPPAPPGYHYAMVRGVWRLIPN